MIRSDKNNKGENSMIELECKECNEPTSCDESAAGVTCSDCVMEIMLKGYSDRSLLEGC